MPGPRKHSNSRTLPDAKFLALYGTGQTIYRVCVTIIFTMQLASAGPIACEIRESAAWRAG
jgi:hypothetical protein